jgi:hypothetical protein
VSGVEDDLGFRAGAPDRLRRYEAGQPRHLDIEQGHLRRARERLLDRLYPIACDRHDVTDT